MPHIMPQRSLRQTSHKFVPFCGYVIGGVVVTKAETKMKMKMKTKNRVGGGIRNLQSSIRDLAQGGRARIGKLQSGFRPRLWPRLWLRRDKSP
jgi:hypothetical protein